MRTCLNLVALAGLALPAAAQATFSTVNGFPDTFGAFVGASSDGVWHVGLQSASSPLKVSVWSASTGPQSLPALPADDALDVSADGRTLGGAWERSDGDVEVDLIRNGVATFLGGLGAQNGSQISAFFAMNDDASAVAGHAWITSSTSRAFRWTSGAGMQDLGALGGGSSGARGISQDGRVVVGWDSTANGLVRPAYWVGASEVLLSSAPGTAWATNADGSVIVGVLEGELLRWDAASGAVKLGKLAGSVAADAAIGRSVSDDGDTIVGLCGKTPNGTIPRAFVWRRGAGMVALEDLLVALGAGNAAGAGLFAAYNVSGDGRTLSGYAANGVPAYVATLPEVASVYCTAKLNSAGCTPAIAFDGTPSASSGAGFEISVEQIMAQSAGLLIYSRTGPASIPFQGGLLCVAGEVVRTPGQLSGGTSGCTGALAIDFNAYVASGADALLTGGSQVWAQWWSRDQGFPPPNNSNLTDALTFTLWP